MVLAAGVGSRLEPLTTQLPKPLVPIANCPVMEHIVRLLADHGFSEICANLHHLPDLIEGYFQDSVSSKIHFLREKELSGDAGGVRACHSFLGQSTFMVLMGDSLTDADLTAVFSEHKKKKALATIGLKQVEDVSRFGVAVLDQDGWIKGFQEKPSPTEAKSNLVSTAIYVLEPEVFNYIPKSGMFGFGRQLFPALVQQGLPVLGVEIDGYWIDVGTIEHYRQANFDALAGQVAVQIPGRLTARTSESSTVWLADGAILEPNVVIEGHALIGRGTIIRSGTRLSGSVVVGDHCLIERNVSLHNTIVWSNVQVGAEAHLTDSIIARHVRVEAATSSIGITVVNEDSSAKVVLT
jgi:NDP-sugar pyrophosphorylase family protein